MADRNTEFVKWDYEPPMLTEINLLDESVRGFSDEPGTIRAPDQKNDEDRFERDINDALGM